MARRYFGTDGVRGTVGQYPITPDFAVLLGQAAGRVLREQLDGRRPTVLIGKDPRISGYMLEAALQAGFLSAGADVLLCGPIPTPAVAYLTRALRLDAGVVISASHNPYTDNGIKFFSEKGMKLPDASEERIEDEIDKGAHCEESNHLGKAKRLDDALGRYVEFCKSTFPQNLNLRGLKLYLDCANGASYKAAPAVFHELGADVVADFVSPDGFNINLHCGATHTDTLAERTAKAGCDLGLSFDGDADRLIMADAQGHVYNGDALLYVLVRDRARHAPVAGVAGTLMTNYALERAFAKEGIPFVRAKVGDRYVMEELLAHDWLYGGESSGHLIARDRHTTGDGIVSALQVLAAIQSQGKSLAELTADLHLMPQVLINCPVQKGFAWQECAPLVAAAKEASAALQGKGRILIRPSGTEPVLRIMAEADSKEEAQSWAQKLAAVLAA